MIGLLQWIFKHFVPYLFGILIGIGFFFLLMYLLPVLPEAPVLDWPAVFESKEAKEVSVPLPAKQERVAAPLSATALPVPPPPAAVAPVPPAAALPALPAAVAPVPPAAASPARVTEVAKRPAAPERVPTPKGAEAGAGASDKGQTDLSDQMATEQPLDADLERDPVEMTSPHPAPSRPAATQPPRNGVSSVDCGPPPMRPGRTMDQYLACQWRADCLNRLNRARSMIERDRKRCPTTGNEGLSCLAYYRALEQQYHPSLCDGGWSAGQMPGWW